MKDKQTAKWPLCDDVSLTVPVMQAPLGPCDGPRLAAEVSRAGGLGCLSLARLDPPRLRQRLQRVCARTSRPVLLALTAQWEPEWVLDTCLAHGARLFQVFWWNGTHLAPRIRAAGGRVFWQIGTPEQAEDAVRAGADVLVAQGTEAGGQVRGGVPLAELIPVLTRFGLPIVAGGGLADREDVRRVLDLGARAAMLGTRFVASIESQADSRYKARLVRARPGDLFIDPRHIGDWPCGPRRRIRSAFDEDRCLRCPLYAGLGVGRIRPILPAAQIVRGLDPAP